MSLRHAPLLYLFYETSRLRRQRELLGSVLGLPLLEVEPDPYRHRHGVSKYDAGGVILAHNLARSHRFREGEADALVTVFGVPPGWSPDRLQGAATPAGSGDGVFTDGEGRHFAFVPSAGLHRPVVEELRLVAPDLDGSIRFYHEVLDLELRERTGDAALLATGSVPIRLVRGDAAPDGGRPRHHSYLIVFHAGEIHETRDALARRGLEFRGPRIGFSEIGGMIRFDDPSGHRMCLYAPSEESLTWGSGPKVIQIAGGHAAAR